MDVTTINCLNCTLLKAVIYILKANKYGIKCNLEEQIRIRDTAYNYLLIGRMTCILSNDLQTKINRFIRKNCKDCG